MKTDDDRTLAGRPADIPPDVVAETILVVDDRPANLMVYKSILEELGQTLITASSGEDALKLVLKHDFAVILLDVNMPTLNGFDTAALIRKRRKSSTTPIIFLTAFTDEMDISQGYASGAVDYLPTPVVPEILKAKVRVFIELSQMRRQAALQAEERVRRQAAEESARQSAFLARASDSLARAQSQADLLRAVVRLSVPDLADMAVAWLASETGEARLEWQQALGDDDIAFHGLSDLPWLENLVAAVMATGQPQKLDGLPPWQPGPAQDLALVPPLARLESAKALPLVVAGQVHGVLVLACAQPKAANPVGDPLANDLAYRVGNALENVLLMDQIREADHRKDEFLGMLGHELRNPLAPIVNCLQLQKMLKPGDPRTASLFETIDRQTRHMGRLIDDLLDATRVAHGKIWLRTERCDLNAIVRQTVEDHRNLVASSGMILDVDIPAETMWVDGDPTRLVQSIGNLMHNAHKFTGPGGRIAVSLKPAADGETAHITVADTGIGIERAMLRHIFDVFRQAEQGLDRSRGGLGLGLTLVRGLVRLHGGDVEADSAGPGRGATFTITLPVAAEEPVTAPAIAPSPNVARKQRILLIEDNRDAAETLHMMLGLEGHDVDVAHTAQAGLARARDFRPDMILCDIGLPEVDGYQVVRSIRQDPQLAATFTVALTGYGREEDQKRAIDAGFDRHLTKPVDFDTLQRLLARASVSENPTA